LGVRIIPVLVERAEMPEASTLPENVKSLAASQATVVGSPRDFEGGVERLIVAVRSGIPSRK
jgi:hypothetical protein